MKAITHSCRRTVLSIVLLASSFSAQAGFMTWPSNPSTVDHITVGFEIFSGCQLGPMPAASIQSLETSNPESAYYQYELLIDLSGTGIVCASPIPPDPLYESYRIGKLPAGSHDIYIRYVSDGETLSESGLSFRVEDIASSTASGAWYAPEQSGRGIFVLRMPLIDGQFHGENLFAVYWATHDADGNPTWAMTSGQMIDNVITGTAITTHGSPLAPGPAELPQSTWGTLSFEYLGCGEGRLNWDAVDPSITDGSVDVAQLARPDSLAPCSVPGSFDVTWVD